MFLQLWLYSGNPYSLDVAFNENGTKIIASRFLIQAINITDSNHEKRMVNDLREICRNSPINVTIFHPYFVFFDQFELVRPTSIQCMVVGAIIMMIISFIFIPNLLCSIWITFSIVSIEIGVVGYMSLWEVNLDSISMINLIMCIGFSIDFTAHICYVYMSSKCKLPSERVREALYSLGLPILQGSVSTILGVVALLLADSYIFLVFFKMVFLVIFFGAMHGLFLLPVMLSLFGPNSCSSSDEHFVDAIMVQYNKDKKDPHMFTITHPHLMNGGSSNSNGSLYGKKPYMNSSLYKAYGSEEKDLGIGTSSEESSENSSSKSQRRKALDDDENVKRRYEEGWRKSAHGLISPTAHGLISPSQFQPIDLYGHGSENLHNFSTLNYSNNKKSDLQNRYKDIENYNDNNKIHTQDLDIDSNDHLHYYDYSYKRKSNRKGLV